MIVKENKKKDFQQDIQQQQNSFCNLFSMNKAFEICEGLVSNFNLWLSTNLETMYF